MPVPSARASATPALTLSRADARTRTRHGMRACPQNVWAVNRLMDDAPELYERLLPYSFAPTDEEQAALAKAQKKR